MSEVVSLPQYKAASHACPRLGSRRASETGVFQMSNVFELDCREDFENSCLVLKAGIGMEDHLFHDL